MLANAIDPSVKKDLGRYLEVPFRLSQTDPEWVPALRSSIAFDLSPRHPFYRHSEAAFFTAGDPAHPTGRIAVLENRNFNTHHNTRHAFFTHFECANDPVIAQTLFTAAADWAVKRGLELLTGPVGFLQTDARGLMISGQGSLTSFALPYHPAYYTGLLNSSGFRKRYDYLSGELSSDFHIEPRVENMAKRMMERTRTTLHCGTSRRELKRIAPQLMEVYKASGTKAPLFYPLSKEEEACILGQLYKTVYPGLVHWLTADENICGVHMATPNYCEALRRAGNGRLARLFAFLRQRAHPREVNLSTTFIIPEYQGRGLLLILDLACQQKAQEIGFRRALVGPATDLNIGKVNVAEKSGVKLDIRHRVFEKEIG